MYPTPSDEDYYMHNSEFSGFASVHDLKRWFDGYFSALKKAGFQCVVYEVDKYEVTYLRSQVCFFKPEGVTTGTPLNLDA